MFQKDDKEIECLGLYGMGGSGKTTMCEALCCYFGPSFNFQVYHLKIGSNDSFKSQENLFQRHKELLTKLLGLSQAQVDRIGDPRKALEDKLRNQPIFLAVDDVRQDLDSYEEVKTYLRYLCPGSKIIITARSQSIVLSVIGHPRFCKPIPHLEKTEALSLFLKIATPKRSLTSLTRRETQILGECLQICFFPIEDEANHNLEAVRDPSVPTEVHHYHPLALRAVASYFKDQYSKLRDIVQCGEDLMQKKKLIFCSDDPKKIIFDVLGIGFNEICHVGKQLFIDVALFAPPPDKEEDIFNWLVVIHANLNPDGIHSKLEHLTKMAFLNYGDGISGHYACKNISMHDLYREYAKLILNKDKNEDSYKYGVYCDDYYQAPPVIASTDWEKVPRVRLKKWKGVIKLREWCGVSVIHLVKCETITTFSIGCELFNLRDLRIRNCSKLEELSWTQEIMAKKLVSDVKLFFVELLFNKNLKTLPDFSDCSELRQITIIECSSSVKPLHLHNCSNLKLLLVAGANVLEVQSLQSCSKLGSVQLTWNASHKGLQVSDLPSLSELSIAGSSILPKDSPPFVPRGHNLFCRHYPEETICVELTGACELTNLKRLHLKYIPLGCLPKGLREIGSSLEYLNLRGCLLSQLVDFSEFPNLEYLSIAQTNVKDVRGLGCMKKLVYLDCRFNFRLKKISDLRCSRMLKYVLLDQCPALQAIPRLPPRCWESGSEDDHRLLLAFDAFANTAFSNIAPPLFAIGSWMPSTNFVTEVTDKLSCVSLSKGIAALLPHRSVICDGCGMWPLMGLRFKARDIRSTYRLCGNCFSNKCHTDHCNFTKSKTIIGQDVSVQIDLNYNLCHACFAKSGCDERDFYTGIHQTMS